MPLLPRISSELYCAVLARPKSMVQSMPFAATEMGRSIWAKDRI